MSWHVPGVMLLALLAACFTVQAHAAQSVTLVTQDQVALRGAASASAPIQTLLWRGEALEVRAQQGEWLQVWDHRRERGGYVRQNQLLLASHSMTDAPALFNLLTFTREQPGAETLSLGLAGAYIQAASREQLAGPQGATALDAWGQAAERLAERASAGIAPSAAGQTALAAHLDVAARYGLKFNQFETDGRMQFCYDGDAWRRVLALPATPEQKARAAVALTRPDCQPPGATPAQREALLTWQAETLSVIDGPAQQALSATWRNRVLMRQAAVHSALAYGLARRGAVQTSAHMNRALTALAAIDKAALGDEDQARYTDAALRVNATRWAAVGAAPGAAPGAPTIQVISNVNVALQATSDGQTCVALIDTKHGSQEQTRRCTWGHVWVASSTVNKEGTALTLAVQTTETWRELWVFFKTAQGWAVQVLPPAALTPGVGYAEFAGWVPGGQQLLVAREANAEGRSKRSFEVLRIDTLGTERQASEASQLGAFQRHADAAWKHSSVSLR